MAVSLALWAVVVGLLAVGIWLCTLSFPGFGLVAGLLVIGVAVQMRPRFGRLPKDASEVTEREAPELWALVRRVAGELNAPVPHTIILDEEQFNAYVTVVGVRRRPVLSIGMPLWLSLGPQQRVALLAHELGHLVNQDPRRGILLQPAYSMLARVSQMLRLQPKPPQGVVTLLTWLVEVLVWLVEWVLVYVFAVLRAVLSCVQIVLTVLTLREGQRAEYRADDLAAKLAGTEAAAQLLDVFVHMEFVDMLVRRDARASVPPDAWQTTAADILRNGLPQRTVRRQYSVRREASLFASHPPTGLRVRLIELRPASSAAVVLDNATDARINAELAKPIARCVRTLRLM